MISLQVNKQVSRKSSKKLVRKRLRKYALYPPALKKIANGEIKEIQQYTPCTCKSICGDQCPCIATGNCCEKYCGYVILFMGFNLDNTNLRKQISRWITPTKLFFKSYALCGFATK